MSHKKSFPAKKQQGELGKKSTAAFPKEPTFAQYVTNLAKLTFSSQIILIHNYGTKFGYGE